MKKKIVIRATVSRPPTRKQLEWFYHESAKRIAKCYAAIDSKVAIKSEKGVYILREKETPDGERIIIGED